MKKVLTAILAVMLIFAFTSCNGSESDSADSSSAALKVSDFSFVVDGVKVTPGEPMPFDKLPEPQVKSKVDSTLYNGEDDIYYFGDYEIITHIEGGENEVYSIFLITPNVTTAEGLRIDDTKEKMLELYGEGYQAEDKKCIYKGEKNELHVIVRDEKVISIELKKTVK